MVDACAHGRIQSWAIFDFKLVVGQPEIDEAGTDALYGCCKEGTLITDSKVTLMDFDREVDPVDEAVRSALADVSAAGFRVARIEIPAANLTEQQA